MESALNAQQIVMNVIVLINAQNVVNNSLLTNRESVSAKIVVEMWLLLMIKPFYAQIIVINAMGLNLVQNVVLDIT